MNVQHLLDKTPGQVGCIALTSNITLVVVDCQLCQFLHSHDTLHYASKNRCADAPQKADRSRHVPEPRAVVDSWRALCIRRHHCVRNPR